MEIVTEILKMFTGKNVKEFDEITPRGNHIVGEILLNHGSFHGSLLIEEVNGEQTQQFIRGFPKIHYFNEDRDERPTGYIRGYEKLDGTCVGMYCLRDENENIIEIVPKSRQRAVLDEHFQEMLSYCDTRRLEKCKDEFNVVYFEMFGMLNEHTLPHKKTYIDLRTIGAVQEQNSYEMMSPTHLKTFADTLYISVPRMLLLVNYRYNHEDFGVDISDPLFGSCRSEMKTFPEVVTYIEKYLDRCNEIYQKEKGYLKYEGVVLQVPEEVPRIIHNNGFQHGYTTTKYIKIKPKTFQEEFHSDYLSVPINEIRKEIQKIINENLTTYLEDYDEKETVSMIKEYLLEDYSDDDVNSTKTRNTIIKELHKYIDSISDKSTNKIVDDILNNNPAEEIAVMMKWFGDNYPMMKHKSRDIYFVLEKRLNKLMGSE